MRIVWIDTEPVSGAEFSPCRRHDLHQPHRALWRSVAHICRLSACMIARIQDAGMPKRWEASATNSANGSVTAATLAGRFGTCAGDANGAASIGIRQASRAAQRDRSGRRIRRNACRRRAGKEKVVHFPCSGMTGQRLAGASAQRPSPPSSVQRGSARPTIEVDGQRAEIPTVEAVLDCRVHQKNLARSRWSRQPVPDRQMRARGGRALALRRHRHCHRQ